MSQAKKRGTVPPKVVPVDVVTRVAEEMRVKVLDFHSLWLGFNMGKMSSGALRNEGALEKVARECLANAPKLKHPRKKKADAA